MNENQPALSPSAIELAKNNITRKEWLQYYKNVWTRNLMARAIDVASDDALKLEDPNTEVLGEPGELIPVKERLERRKLHVQDALAILKGVEILMGLSEEEIEAKFLSEEALKVASDMMPEVPKDGDKCLTTDGKEGVLKTGENGSFDCIPNAEEVKQEETKPEVETAVNVPQVEEPAKDGEETNNK